jgi:hypothetical protein
MGSVDGMMVLTRERGTDNGKLIVTGREIEKEHAYTLLWDMEMASWRMTDPHTHTMSADDTRQTSIQAVVDAANEPITVQGVIEQLIATQGPQEWMTAHKIGTDLGRLAMAGKIRRLDRGLYAPINTSNDFHSRGI